MKLSKNMFALNVYSGVKKSSDSLYTSMRRLSSGEKLTRPGDAPSDYGISGLQTFIPYPLVDPVQKRAVLGL